MRTVYEIHDKDGGRGSGPWADPQGAEWMRNWCDDHRPATAPHTVVERQVAGPEDTDELLRLRALVDDLRAVVNDPSELWRIRTFAASVLDARNLGGES